MSQQAPRRGRGPRSGARFPWEEVTVASGELAGSTPNGHVRCLSLTAIKGFEMGLRQSGHSQMQGTDAKLKLV